MKILENKNNVCVVENQDKSITLFSYNSEIATIKNGEVTTTGLENYSRTTKKHYNQFIKTYLK